MGKQCRSLTTAGWAWHGGHRGHTWPWTWTCTSKESTIRDVSMRVPCVCLGRGTGKMVAKLRSVYNHCSLWCLSWVWRKLKRVQFWGSSRPLFIIIVNILGLWQMPGGPQSLIGNNKVGKVLKTKLLKTFMAKSCGPRAWPELEGGCW